MSESNDKHGKIYVDHPNDKSKSIGLIHGHSHSSDDFKVVGDFCYKYAKSRPTNYRGNNPANKNEFSRQTNNNDIVKQEFYEILLHENHILSAEEESNQNIESDFDEN